MSEAKKQKLITVRECAQELGVGLMTAYRWIKNGYIPAVRFGRTIRVPADKLTDVLKGEKRNEQ